MAMWRREPELLEHHREILDLRHFSSADLRPLLETEVQVWSELLEWDYRGSAEMILRYVDAKILPGYAAVQNGAVSGYCFFVYEGSKGVIGDLFVSEWAGLGGSVREVEQELLRHVIDTLQQSPGVHRIEAQLLVHDTGSLSSTFTDERFRRYPRLFMVLPLQGREAPRERDVRLPGDIELRRWAEQDYQAVASAIMSAYRNHVDSEINDQYRTVSGALRFLNNIVRFPGCGTFDPNASFVAVEKGARSVVGVILCSRVKDDVGHVTQVCLLPDERGRGIGEALLNASANELRKRRFSYLTLTVTEANAGAVNLYKKLGYAVNRVFDAFVWEG
ncbi:MAG TPA: GNAT family N-acetyltransferase [Terriglobales bacterium]|nr:GNAT family N-acetyltransferase [Terriglobales bacterium]